MFALHNLSLLLFRTFSVPQNCVTLKFEQLGLPFSFKLCKTPRSSTTLCVLNVNVKSHAQCTPTADTQLNLHTFTKPLYLFPSQSQPCIQFFRASTGSRSGRTLSGRMVMYVLTLDSQRFFDCDSSPRYIISMYNPHEESQVTPSIWTFLFEVPCPSTLRIDDASGYLLSIITCIMYVLASEYIFFIKTASSSIV